MCHPHSPCSASWLQGHPRVEIFPPQGLQGPPGQHSPALGAGRGSLIACVPWGCSSQGCCILRHYCININIYIYISYIYFALGACTGRQKALLCFWRGAAWGGGTVPCSPRWGPQVTPKPPWIVPPPPCTGSKGEMGPCIAGGGPGSALGDQAGPVLRAGVQTKPQGMGPARCWGAPRTLELGGCVIV